MGHADGSHMGHGGYYRPGYANEAVGHGYADSWNQRLYVSVVPVTMEGIVVVMSLFHVQQDIAAYAKQKGSWQTFYCSGNQQSCV